MVDDAPDRRKFLKFATCAAGTGIGLAVGIPTLGLVVDPATRTTVTLPTEPLDIMPLDKLRIGGDPRRVDVIAPIVKDAWTSASNVVLGSAWLRRLDKTKIEAFSAVCPHLGCTIGWDSGDFLCPCHDSRFSVDGARKTGPSERGLDPLPVEVKDGRLQLTWIRYKNGGTTREPV